LHGKAIGSATKLDKEIIKISQSRFYSTTRMKHFQARPLAIEVFILAGGLGSRMGRDKSRLRLVGRTMPGHIQKTIAAMGLKARTIRQDAVARCGPIGGIYTALKISRADVVMFLACDMPFVSARFLDKFLRGLRPADPALMAGNEDGFAGFPMLLRTVPCLPLVSRQIEQGQLSLQSLARTVKARLFRPSRDEAAQLQNINTPSDLERARIQMQMRFRGRTAKLERHT
jgi:molybdopterin-guanine dinucleotide biosynthesis protein A